MSWDATLFSQKDAPVANVEEWAVLVALSERCDDDGCNAYQSQPTIAGRTRLSVKTVYRRLKDMEDRGILKRGDQSVVAHLPADTRPVVYDIQIPYAWFSNIERINRYRAEHGRPPLVPEDRPPLAPAPPKKTRADKGSTRPITQDVDNAGESVDNRADEVPAPTTGLQVPPSNGDISTGLQVRPDYKSEGTGLQVRGDWTTSRTTLGFESSIDLRRTSPTSSADDVAAGQEQEKKISSSRGTPAKPDGWPDLTDWEQALHAELMALRPDWSARTLRKVLGSDEIRQRENRDLVRMAFIIGARTLKTTTPNRLLHEHCPHWRQAFEQMRSDQTPSPAGAEVPAPARRSNPTTTPAAPSAAYLAAKQAEREKIIRNRPSKPQKPAEDRIRQALEDLHRGQEAA